MPPESTTSEPRKRMATRGLFCEIVVSHLFSKCASCSLSLSLEISWVAYHCENCLGTFLGHSANMSPWGRPIPTWKSWNGIVQGEMYLTQGDHSSWPNIQLPSTQRTRWELVTQWFIEQSLDKVTCSESLQGVGALPLRRFVDLAAGWGGNAAIAAVVRYATVAGSRWDHVGPAISIGLL